MEPALISLGPPRRAPEILALVAVCLVFGLGPPACSSETDLAQPAPSEPPNIIFILTDDMSLDDLEYMPKAQELLVDKGATFQNAFVTTSLCCPSRASILLGQYAHNHEVMSNRPPLGGFEKFRDEGHEDETVATWLQAGGYRTALIGKYLNRYEEVAPTHLPPGWDEWYGRAGSAGFGGNGYYDYRLNENGTLVSYGSKGAEDYQTDVLARKATDFVRRAAQDGQPFLLYVSPKTPHSPHSPAPRHEGAFADAQAPRTPAFDEKDVSDKPARVSKQPRLSPKKIAQIDDEYRGRLETLLAVDDMISGLIEELEAGGELDDTYVVFASDNGFHLGQHRLPPHKDTVYEEDIRVPLVVRGPGVPAGLELDQLVLNTDLAPTFAEWGGVSAPSTVDGRSLAPLLTGEGSPATWRSAFLVEHWAGGGSKSSASYYKAVRTAEYKYVEYGTGEHELYDLRADPYELENYYETADPSLVAQLQSRLEALRDCAGETCHAAEDGT